MFPLTLKDLPLEAKELIADLGLVPVKLTNDYDPVIFWSSESDCDCIRQRIREEDSLYASWEKMGEVMPLQSLREYAEDLFQKSTCLSPAVQLSLDFTYD